VLGLHARAHGAEDEVRDQIDKVRRVLERPVEHGDDVADAGQLLQAEGKSHETVVALRVLDAEVVLEQKAGGQDALGEAANCLQRQANFRGGGLAAVPGAWHVPCAALIVVHAIVERTVAHVVGHAAGTNHRGQAPTRRIGLTWLVARSYDDVTGLPLVRETVTHFMHLLVISTPFFVRHLES